MTERFAPGVTGRGSVVAGLRTVLENVDLKTSSRSVPFRHASSAGAADGAMAETKTRYVAKHRLAGYFEGGPATSGAMTVSILSQS